jgi:tetratricopeptide (TPR) repeat protein
MSTPRESLPRGLVVGVLVMTLAVLGLGGAVIALKLRPQPLPTNVIERDVVLWRQQVEDTPGEAGAHTGLGLALLRAEHAVEAQAEFEEAIRLDETSWMAEFQLALLLRDDDPDRALTLLADAARQAPQQERVAPYVAQGDLLMSQGDAQAAKVAYEKAVAFGPFTFDAHLGLAKALEALGETEAALEEYREAGRFDPTNQEIADAIDRLTS